jgi:hypothetical protein
LSVMGKPLSIFCKLNLFLPEDFDNLSRMQSAKFAEVTPCSSYCTYV